MKKPAGRGDKAGEQKQHDADRHSGFGRGNEKRPAFDARYGATRAHTGKERHVEVPKRQSHEGDGHAPGKSVVQWNQRSTRATGDWRSRLAVRSMQVSGITASAEPAQCIERTARQRAG